jgi:hypothetical protein
MAIDETIERRWYRCAPVCPHNRLWVSYRRASKEPLSATRSLEVSGIPRPTNGLNAGTRQCVAGSFYLGAQSGTHLTLPPTWRDATGAALV